MSELKSLLDDPRRLAEVMKLLSDPTRLQIISVLASRRDVTGSELAPMVGITQGTASHHLARLRQAGLVSRGRDMASVPHRLEPPAFAELAKAVSALDVRRGRKVRAR